MICAKCGGEKSLRQEILRRLRLIVESLRTMRRRQSHRQAVCGECGTLLGAGVPPLSGRKGEAGEVHATEIPPPESLSGERKTVTVLFTDIEGSMELMEALDPEKAHAIVDPALKVMIDTVHRYDGYIVQSTGDGFSRCSAPRLLTRIIRSVHCTQRCRCRKRCAASRRGCARKKGQISRSLSAPMSARWWQARFRPARVRSNIPDRPFDQPPLTPANAGESGFNRDQLKPPQTGRGPLLRRNGWSGGTLTELAVLSGIVEVTKLGESAKPSLRRGGRPT
jgi:class 3 adenylate cyclase